MNPGNDWKGQNIPRIHKDLGRSPVSILPVLECFLEFNEDNITDLLPSDESYGWGDSMANIWAWVNNTYKVVYFTPDFSRYGCIPEWFPNVDSQGRLLTDQGWCDRFLYLLDHAYGGLPDDHTEVSPRGLVQAILELHENMGEYVEMEEEDGMEWEKSNKA